MKFSAGLFFLLTLLLLQACASSGPSSSGSSSTESRARTEALPKIVTTNDPQVIILHLSDLHGRLRIQDGYGGYARIATIIKEERKRAGPKTDVLVIAGGDSVGKGALPCRKTNDLECVALLKDLGVDLAVFGNGELKQDLSHLQKLIARSGVTWIGANVQASAESWQKSFTYNGPKSGAKFLIFNWSQGPGPGELALGKSGVRIQEQVGAAQWAAWQKLAAEKGAPVLWVTHQEMQNDLHLLSEACKPQYKFNNLALLKANDHVQSIDQSNCAPLYQAGAYGKALSRLVLRPTKAPGGWRLVAHDFISVTQATAEDEVVAKKIESLYRTHAPNADEVLAAQSPAKSVNEVALWLADAYRNISRADLSIINEGAVKDGLTSAAPTREQILQVVPYNNQLMGFDISKAELEKALCKAATRPRDMMLDNGSQLYFSGAQLVGAGTNECRLEGLSKASLKVVVDDYMVRRSERWLGKNVAPLSFRFGVTTEQVLVKALTGDRSRL